MSQVNFENMISKYIETEKFVNKFLYRSPKMMFLPLNQ